MSEETRLLVAIVLGIVVGFPLALWLGHLATRRKREREIVRVIQPSLDALARAGKLVAPPPRKPYQPPPIPSSTHAMLDETYGTRGRELQRVADDESLEQQRQLQMQQLLTQTAEHHEPSHHATPSVTHEPAPHHEAPSYSHDSSPSHDHGSSYGGDSYGGHDHGSGGDFGGGHHQ